MFEYWVEILTSIVAALSAGGWFLSKHHRKSDREKHAAELERARAESAALRQKSDIDYTQKLLEIYSAHIVQPLKDEINSIKAHQEHYEAALSKAPLCSVFPNCPIVVELQSQIQNANRE